MSEPGCTCSEEYRKYHLAWHDYACKAHDPETCAAPGCVNRRRNRDARRAEGAPEDPCPFAPAAKETARPAVPAAPSEKGEDLDAIGPAPLPHHALNCPGLIHGVRSCVCGAAGPPRLRAEEGQADRWATLVTEGEATGCYPCDTCTGFRARGQPCQRCVADLTHREMDANDALIAERDAASAALMKVVASALCPHMMGTDIDDPKSDSVRLVCGECAEAELRREMKALEAAERRILTLEAERASAIEEAEAALAEMERVTKLAADEIERRKAAERERDGWKTDNACRAAALDAALSALAALRVAARAVLARIDAYEPLTLLGADHDTVRVLRSLSPSTAEPASDVGAGNADGGEGKGTT